ncbi:MAG: hypothetical protein R3256_02930 [Thalassovita sp.]|nr:hypothetical protein [Thalassovita sp.]
MHARRERHDSWGQEPPIFGRGSDRILFALDEIRAGAGSTAAHIYMFYMHLSVQRKIRRCRANSANIQKTKRWQTYNSGLHPRGAGRGSHCGFMKNFYQTFRLNFKAIYRFFGISAQENHIRNLKRASLEAVVEHRDGLECWSGIPMGLFKEFDILRGNEPDECAVEQG